MINSITVQVNAFYDKDSFKTGWEETTELSQQLKKVARLLFFLHDPGIADEDKGRTINWYWEQFIGGPYRAVHDVYGVIFTSGPIIISQNYSDREGLARAFSTLLKDVLGPEKNGGEDVFARMLQEHVQGGYGRKDTCVTHDFCDSKNLMSDAFYHYFGYRPEGMNDVHNALIDSSWRLAKEQVFYYGSPR